VFAQRLALIVLEADEDSPMAGSGPSVVVSLIEDQLEAEQTDLKHDCPTLFLKGPVH
jgi:hypothetical protein